MRCDEQLLGVTCTMRLFSTCLRFAVVASVLALGLTSPVAAQQSATNSDSAKVASDPFLVEVEQAIEMSARRRLDADVHTPWQIMHGVLSFGNEFKVRKNGKEVSAVEWMSTGPSYRGDPWFEKTPFGGRAHTYTKPYAFEGHPNQFLAVLSHGGVPMDQTFKTADGSITIADMVRHAQADVNDREEITWTLWALSHYLGTDVQWKNRTGEAWSIERLVRIQARESTSEASCGGTHGLFALARTRNIHRSSGKPMRGVWLEADQTLQRYIQSARALQNRDGSFSNSYFTGRANTNDFIQRCTTSGHTLEFLMMALSDEGLKQEWVRRGIASVARGLNQHRNEPIDCGPLYHAVSGLVVYRDRVKPKVPAQVADAGNTDDSESKPDNPTAPATTTKKVEDAVVAAKKAATKKAEEMKAAAKKATDEAQQAEEIARKADAETRQAEQEAMQAEEAARKAGELAVAKRNEARKKREFAEKKKAEAKVKREQAKAKASLANSKAGNVD